MKMTKLDDFVEKRRCKRESLSLPIEIKISSGGDNEKRESGVTNNLSYTGAYVADISTGNVNIGDKVKISLSIPKDDVSIFPFSRIAGTARIVRVEREGFAVEFSEEICRLFFSP